MYFEEKHSRQNYSTVLHYQNMRTFLHCLGANADVSVSQSIRFRPQVTLTFPFPPTSDDCRSNITHEQHTRERPLPVAHSAPGGCLALARILNICTKPSLPCGRWAFFG